MTLVGILNPHVLRVLYMLIDEARIIDPGACNSIMTALIMLLSQVVKVK
jgi:hypothetical protein